MNVLTRFVLAHRRLVAGCWLVVAIAAFAALTPAGNALSDQFSLPGEEAFETNRELDEIYGNGGDIAPIVPVVRLPRGTTVDSPGIARQLDAALAKIERALPEARTASYASTRDRAFVSDDGRTTFALVLIPAKGGVDPGWTESQAAQTAVKGVTVGGSPVEVTGLDALRSAAGENDSDDTGVLVGTLLAALSALLVLAFVFRSFMALVPLLMAFVAIPTTFLLIWPLASITDVSVIVQFLVALIGLGIAIDYALLVVVRWREERQRPDVTNEVAVRNAMTHAGSAVVFSGTTVAISLLALLVLPVPFLRSIGIAGLLIALVSVAVAVTLLPVLLATIGPKLDWPRNRREARPSPGWSAWAQLVVRHRWAAAVGSTAVLAALVVAAASIQLGSPRADSLGNTGPARAGLEKLQGAGIGDGPLSPFEALVRDGDAGAVARALAKVEGVRSAAAPADWRSGETALVTVIPTADGNSAAGRATLDRIRATTLPGDVTIGGDAALSADFLDAVYGRFPLILALISVLTFVLLARAFRSLVLPLKAVVLNLLSVAAAWGLIVLVWQEGFGSEAIWGIEATQAINVELPIVIFAFLFGISMDYQVFIISRMREAYDRTGSTATAVVEGIGRTGRLVTSAALILGLAFVAFSAQPGTEAKIFATALGGGILIDATIIRGILAPAAVATLGRWNWWLPAWSARLLRAEPSRAQPVAATGTLATAAGPSVAGAAGSNGGVPPVAAAPLRIQTYRASDRATLVLGGELDLRTVPVLRTMLDDIERDAPPLIVVDLRALRFMDSSGLGELVHADRRARGERRRVVLVTGSAPIDRILGLSGVTEMFETTADPATLESPGSQPGDPS
ncbi:MAG: anti-sigma factor antagonist [Solirubrobacteraceae bacterium]|nr:anti-sigma factor antagonist [Solirubrobacteraceae bacterium]